MRPLPPENADGFRYFSRETDPKLFACPHTGFPGIQYRFVHRLDQLRHKAGFPFVITSGYRSPDHPEEAWKEVPGTHGQGIAADIKVSGGAQRYELVRAAIELGFTGIGVHTDFVHVDTRESTPVLWGYDK